MATQSWGWRWSPWKVVKFKTAPQRRIQSEKRATPQEATNMTSNGIRPKGIVGASIHSCA